VLRFPLDTEQIQRLLPHRTPMLLVDRVLEISSREEGIVVAEKRVREGEPFLRGHFPGRPVMPGVLIIEALAQAGAIGICYWDPSPSDRVLALVGVDRARFRHPVVPGDTLTLRTRVLRSRGDLIVAEGVASVAGVTAAEATVMASFVDWKVRA
jgi:beta-hydroxyacyl-ACP dehydratase FabZ